MALTAEQQITHLRSLLDILTTSTNDLIAELSSSSSTSKSKAANGAAANHVDVRVPADPKTEEARKRVIAATASLEAAVFTPQWRLGHLAHSYFVSRALHMVVEWEIPQLLATNGPMSLDALAAATGVVDTRKLGLVMRTLCAHHVFAETALDVFANDEASAALATDERLANSVRYASFLFPTADVLPGLLKDPALCASYASRDSAFAKSIGKGMGQFEYLNAHPEWRDCFNLWLASLGEYLHGLTDVGGYPWESTLRNGAVVVDVGGGLGSSIQALRTNFPDRRGREDFVGIVQDQPGMIEHATAHWQKTDPEALATGAVKLTVHDFFQENPVKGADVYWFRSVIVDWQDDDLTKMFTHIKNAMAPGKSRLLIGEYIMHPTCGDDMLPNAPSPLLKNYGEFQTMGLISGFILTVSPNGVQRTIQDLSKVVEAAGLKIVKVWICRGLGHVIECRLKEDAVAAE
ncbi:Putative O-methyltransferase domain, S-adenosyl-L-methionine-dependent methyltransferase superfamily [Colletotrichum destructivum]|uniref:O-methyltransferase domain, S-adenosyl-L-methionine-dependent methyltransferase superfamily n=1 Tax=Colletotrichum destructivum TaxID=34406 RepID=A0AAX4IXJ9_9PEZI|nr:Putative O-methyltransferase domain, S-adenosyl-L-methionine-dependent methyltransferase superfamily [Colletotrichum destructivum]